MTLAQRLAEIRERLEAACARSRRDSRSVKVIAAVKGVEPSSLLEALAAGITDFGENRVQEADSHISEMGEQATLATWHMIGHLQTNKVPAALGLFAMIQSVDSLRLARILSQQATGDVPVLLEVNIGGEASKHGFLTGALREAITEIQSLPHLKLHGLMTVPPAVPTSEEARPFFAAVAELAALHGLRELSMGMTNDFEAAIEEGATMIRLGRGLFGERSQ